MAGCPAGLSEGEGGESATASRERTRVALTARVIVEELPSLIFGRLDELCRKIDAISVHMKENGDANLHLVVEYLQKTADAGNSTESFLFEDDDAETIILETSLDGDSHGRDVLGKETVEREPSDGVLDVSAGQRQLNVNINDANTAATDAFSPEPTQACDAAWQRLA